MTSYRYLRATIDRFLASGRIVSLIACAVTAGTASAQVEFLFSFGSQGSGDGQFESPRGIAIAGDGDIYVSDRDLHRVQVFDRAGNYKFQFGNAGAGNGEFGGPFDLAVNSVTGNIHVADHDNNRVQVFDSMGNYQFQFGDLPGSPRAIGVDANGSTYVDDGAGSIHVFDGAGAFQFQFGSPGSGNGQLARPHGIAFNTDGDIYVTEFDNNRVQVFDSAGNYKLQFGVFGSGNGEFSAPWGVAFDAGGDVYVTDAHNDRIQVFDSAASYKYQFGNEGNIQVESPDGIAIDATANIYVAEFVNQRVSVWRMVKELDFDGDGDVGVDDVDALVGEIVAGTNNSAFDLTVDGTVNDADLTKWLGDAATQNAFLASYLRGDANLDGIVNAADLNNLAQNWLGSPNAWQWGDFTADGFVNAEDLNHVGQNWLQSVPFANEASAVPEPMTHLLIASGAVCLILVRRRRYTWRPAHRDENGLPDVLGSARCSGETKSDADEDTRRPSLYRSKERRCLSDSGFPSPVLLCP